ncbi:hypothetical protein DFH09DRAFT_1081090 [Mycena vulgaris]|nr:hypothetical protein DFH09DRAFT_1081090 [Mycena vulgaris]
MGEESRMPEDKRELLFAPAQPPGLAIPSDLPSWASKSCSKAQIQLGASKSAVVSGHSLWNPAGLVVSAREMLPVSESFLYRMFLPADDQTVLSKEAKRVVRLSEAPARAKLVWIWGVRGRIEEARSQMGSVILELGRSRSEAEMGKDGGCGRSLGGLARSRKSEILVGKLCFFRDRVYYPHNVRAAPEKHQACTISVEVESEDKDDVDADGKDDTVNKGLL